MALKECNNTLYACIGGDGSTGTINLSVTGITGNSTVVITRDIAIERTTDFQTSGPFAISVLNVELDKIIAILADLDDAAQRALILPDSDPTSSITLPSIDTRKIKFYLSMRLVLLLFLKQLAHQRELMLLLLQ